MEIKQEHEDKCTDKTSYLTGNVEIVPSYLEISLQTYIHTRKLPFYLGLKSSFPAEVFASKIL